MSAEPTIAVTASRSIPDLDAFVKPFGRALDRVAAALGFPGDFWGLMLAAHWRHGGAPGGDSWFAALFKLRHGERYYDEVVEVIRPDYTKYANNVAPLERNTVLIEPAHACIAIWTPSEPGSRKHGGTYDTIRKAAAKGIPTIVEIIGATQ